MVRIYHMILTSKLDNLELKCFAYILENVRLYNLKLYKKLETK